MKFSYRLDSMDTDCFEKFAVELVRRKFDIEAFQGFPRGKDDGIDGIDDIKNHTFILQAKRWIIEFHVKQISEDVENQIRESFEWKDINKETLDYEILRGFIKETILEELSIFNSKYYRNEVDTNNILEFKTVESIL
ncbi:TPA: restriction endonuclease, partial [Staphylococcus delphini]|nr:restriction endonuclease [Staphylococcus delphini]